MALLCVTSGCGPARTLLIAGVLFALCFSLGEGLRLLPLPFTPSGAGQGAHSRPGVSSRVVARQNQFTPGSLSLPPRAQKNHKYQQKHCAPPSGCALTPPDASHRHYRAEWRAGRGLSAPALRLAGRAPPRTA